MKKDYFSARRVTAWPEIGAGGRAGYGVDMWDGNQLWVPADVFEKEYHPIADGMSFSLALAAVRGGKRVAREGWNGKGMFIFLVGGSTFTVNREPLLSILGEGTEVQYHGHIDMKTAQGYIVPWLASQADMLADDWSIVPDAPIAAAAAAPAEQAA